MSRVLLAIDHLLDEGDAALSELVDVVAALARGVHDLLGRAAFESHLEHAALLLTVKCGDRPGQAVTHVAEPFGFGQKSLLLRDTLLFERSDVGLESRAR